MVLFMANSKSKLNIRCNYRRVFTKRLLMLLISNNVYTHYSTPLIHQLNKLCSMLTLHSYSKFCIPIQANEDKKYTAIFRVKFQHFFSALSQFRLGQVFLSQVRLCQFNQVQVRLEICVKKGMHKLRCIFCLHLPKHLVWK